MIHGEQEDEGELDFHWNEFTGSVDWKFFANSYASGSNIVSFLHVHHSN